MPKPIDESSSKLIYSVKILDLSRGGSGVGKVGDQILFVPYTLPGDVVEVKILKKHKRYLTGECIKILEPSPDRIHPKCAFFGKCGGCEWQHVPYSLQWEIKKRGVYQALSRKDKSISFPEPIEFQAEEIWNYRNRIQMRSDEKINSLGYYSKNSNQLVRVNRCEISDERVNKKIEWINKEILKNNPQYIDKKIELEVREGEVQIAINRPHAAFGFRQVNDAQNEKLKKWASEHFKEKGTLFDLYGGFGNLSRSFISKMDTIHCVDLSVPEQKNSPDARYFFHQSDVLPFLKTIHKKLKSEITTRESPRFALMDPPREGLGKDASEIVKHLKSLKVKSLILVSCDVDSFVRDFFEIQSGGYICKEIALFDFFPHTPHVESAAFFSL